jgi:tetratricopeptide (TPR) repeat protein
MSSINILRGTAALVTVLLAAVPGVAQTGLEAEYARADRLHDQAVQVDLQTDADILTAARKHGDVAEHRLVSDPRAVECNRFQANLLYVLGDYEGARRSLESAAGLAIANGDMATTAFIYLDRAVVAEKQGDSRTSIELARIAATLAQTEYLTADQRYQVEQRIAMAR